MDGQQKHGLIAWTDGLTLAILPLNFYALNFYPLARASSMKSCQLLLYPLAQSH